MWTMNTFLYKEIANQFDGLQFHSQSKDFTAPDYRGIDRRFRITVEVLDDDMRISCPHCTYDRLKED